MEINYVDSRTDKERLKDEKVQRITTTTVPKNGKIVYIKLNNNHFRDVKKKGFKMIKIDFPNTKQGHTCESYKDGYKVIYICPKCGYRMEDNHETGNFEVVNKGNFKVKHSGSYYEPSKLEIFKNQN